MADLSSFFNSIGSGISSLATGAGDVLGFDKGGFGYDGAANFSDLSLANLGGSTGLSSLFGSDTSAADASRLTGATGMTTEELAALGGSAAPATGGSSFLASLAPSANTMKSLASMAPLLQAGSGIYSPVTSSSS